MNKPPSPKKKHCTRVSPESLLLQKHIEFARFGTISWIPWFPRIPRKCRHGPLLGPPLPRAPGARMTVVKQTPSNIYPSLHPPVRVTPHHHHHPSFHFYRRMLGCGEPPFPGPGERQAAQLPNHTRPRQDHLNLGWSRRVGWVGVGPP